VNVKELRERHGITQKALAKATGIPRDRIAKWEQDKGMPKAEDERILTEYFKRLKGEEIPSKPDVPPRLNEPAENHLKDAGGTWGNDQPGLTRLMLEALKKLTESNTAISESNKSVSDSNQILARSNEELVQLLKSKSATSEFEKKTLLETVATVRALREYAIEITAKVKHRTADSVRKDFRKAVNDELEKIQEVANTDTPSVDGK
jgi:transcriptional regulator with XRE-family HTH domain